MKEFLLTLLQSILIAAVPTISAFICKFLWAKAKEAMQRIQNEDAKRLMQEAMDAVDAAVVSTTQTYVDTLKKNGQFSLANQQEAFQMSYNTAVAIMTQEAKDFITNAYGALDDWLKTQIEASVKRNK